MVHSEYMRLILEFDNYLRSKECCEDVCEHTSYIGTLLDYLSRRRVLNISSLQNKHVEGFMKRYKRKKEQQECVKVLGYFFRFLNEKGYL